MSMETVGKYSGNTVNAVIENILNGVNVRQAISESVDVPMVWIYEILNNYNDVVANCGDSYFDTEREAIKDAEDFIPSVADDNNISKDSLLIKTYNIPKDFLSRGW